MSKKWSRNDRASSSGSRRPWTTVVAMTIGKIKTLKMHLDSPTPMIRASRGPGVHLAKKIPGPWGPRGPVNQNFPGPRGLQGQNQQTFTGPRGPRGPGSQNFGGGPRGQIAPKHANLWPKRPWSQRFRQFSRPKTARVPWQWSR